jgi:biopolymer transport protein ExbD
MAGGMDLGSNNSKGGKRPLDTQINLVPFIDLMAVTIAFLIMTAVWTQIGRLEVSNSGNSSEDTEPTKEVPVFLVVTDKELRLNIGGTAMEPIPVERDGSQRLLLTRLQSKVKEVKAQLPDQASITVQPEDTVRYDDLVRIIDELIGAGLQNVSVASAMG